MRNRLPTREKDPRVQVEPVILEGKRVRLVPLEQGHLDALGAIGLDPALWEWTGGRIQTHNGMRAYIERALSRPDTLAFATTIRETHEVVGCTRFGNISVEHRRVEIGWTWIARPWQRSFVNTEAKLLMLRHAFEDWGCQRVELKTHEKNARSRAAIERLGARFEGTLRKHMIQPDGTSRDTVYYAITDDEWPAVSEHLQEKLA